MTTPTDKTTTREEKIYVLYGSQTGNSEQSAKDFCRQAATRLSPAQIRAMTAGDSNDNNNQKEEDITVVTQCMQLDDFLELEHGAWTRFTVIFTSSYGVGQAPLGCYRFRDLCEAWLSQKDHDDDAPAKVLDGFSYALCGLGDSKYTTYFQNPTRINAGLTQVGATRVGPLGKADASGEDEQEQGHVIAQWMDNIWPHIAKVVVQPPLSTERMQQAQDATVKLCCQINPDFVPPKKYTSSSASGNIPFSMVVFALLLVLVAMIVAYYQLQ